MPARKAVVATLSSLALVAAFIVGGAAPAMAATPAKSAAANYSCWVDLDTAKSVCVAKGVDLDAAVKAKTGITLTYSFVRPSVAAKLQALNKAVGVKTAPATVVISTLYDDVSYGGGTFKLSSTGACSAGATNLGDYGWNDRASSFKSLSGCTTAIWSDAGYSGARVGYTAASANFGAMNDKASSIDVNPAN